MSDIIKLLPDSVANQIAAGEVIQRPASVVKELMENSVDAGARNIRIIIKDAGKTLIQVIDDGLGMSETDARLSFERHATSKINTAHDLFSITTKGFRGEALASIAAVAMVELKTRRKEDEAGTIVIISGSRIETQDVCSCPAGSSFSVKNLFFNVPARRKFLKSDNTEIRHIINEFQKVALAHHEIRFLLFHNDTEIYNLQETNRKQRITGVFGKNISQDLIALNTETSLIRISGFIGKPENARRTFGEQFFFVNNRFMKHPYFHKAVVEAYSNMLAPDVIPSYFVFLEAEPERIDINIHPTKTEVKFEDERAIWQILMASSREALGRFNITPSIDFENEALIDIPVLTGRNIIPEMPGIEIHAGYNPFEGDERPQRENIVERFEREKAVPEPEQIVNSIKPKLFQIKNKYIVCPVKSGLMLIDQKRAHERILFESFMENLSSANVSSQKILYPGTMELSAGDYYVLKEIYEQLRILGFDIQELGNNVITINGIPEGAGKNEPGELLQSFLDEYKGKLSDPGAGIKERVASALARTSAIRYGRQLAQGEMEELFDRLFACQAPNYSPTGKPVVQIITLEELDKRFK
jgi:DNA mismatch repair protein MutL